jgi:Zn-dependent protease
MHDHEPSEVEGEYQPPLPGPQKPQKGWRNAGGVAVGIGLLAAKFKGVIALLLSFKWIFLGAKFALSFGTIFASIWFYALFYGWKLGIMVVMLILVHELGHYFAFRAMGTEVSLPYFIPGMGAFVAPKALPPSPAHGAVATLMGPVLGIAASILCYAYGLFMGEHFWYAVAYIGFFLNAFNLIPLVPFDGGRIAEIIDARLFWIGIVLFAIWVAFAATRSPFAWLIIAFVGISAIPRVTAALHGYVSPDLLATPPRTRLLLALGYFVTLAVAIAGAGVTLLER